MTPWFEVCIPILILPTMLVILLCIYGTSSYLRAHKEQNALGRPKIDGSVRGTQAALANLKVPS